MSATASPDPLPAVTPPDWAERQLPHLDTLLLEQAHLEKKAAAGALNFLFRLPANAPLQRQLSALAREELLHFERTLKLLQQREIAFGLQESSGYAERLKKAVRRDGGRLRDELLVAAIIEHRSHERMTLLARATAATEPEVSRFYAELCPAEERHEGLYLELATLVSDAQTVATRHQELLTHEANVLAELPFCARLHGGLAAAEAR